MADLLHEVPRLDQLRRGVTQRVHCPGIDHRPRLHRCHDSPPSSTGVRTCPHTRRGVRHAPNRPPGHRQMRARGSGRAVRPPEDDAGPEHGQDGHPAEPKCRRRASQQPSLREAAGTHSRWELASAKGPCPVEGACQSGSGHVLAPDTRAAPHPGQTPRPDSAATQGRREATRPNHEPVRATWRTLGRRTGQPAGQTTGGRPARVTRQTVAQRIGRCSPGSIRQPSRNPSRHARRASRSRTRSRVTTAQVPG